MKRLATRPFVLAAALASAASFAAPASRSGERAPDFNREVRPILADRCFRCHGPDAGARKRGLRLDTQDGSRAKLASGEHAFVPRDVDASEALRRIASDDPDEVMPPPSLKHPLDEAQKATLVRWVRAGAEYAPHWAYVAPKKSAPPPVKAQSWCRDELDRFVLAELEARGLEPAPEADRVTLLRRAALALTGLPPTPEEADAFAVDSSPDAYSAALDRLLASPRSAERLAADWLDVARYADTWGYQSDWETNTWPWRDELLAAFMHNQPYDEFVRDQIAGDLVPNATRDQKLATTFCRLHRMTNEGGSIDEEFRSEYVADRVITYGTAFLGLTLECARCHDHKYDPIPQTDFYTLGAFFGAIDESGTYAYSTGATPSPVLRLPTPEQEAALDERTRARAAAEAQLGATLGARRAEFDRWLASAPKLAPPAAVKHYPLDGAIDGPTGKATALDGDSGPSFDDVPAFRRCDAHSMVFWMRADSSKARATVIHTSQFTIESDQQGYQVMLLDGKLAWQVLHFWPGSAAAVRTRDAFPIGRWVEVAVTYDGSSRAAGLHVYLDGEPAALEIERDHLDGAATVRSFQIGFRDRDVGFRGGAVDDLSVFDRELSALEVAELFHPGALADALQRRDPRLFDVFARTLDEPCREASKSLRDARAAEQDLLESLREIPVMEATDHPRQMFVLTRGAYDQPDHARPVASDHALSALLPFDERWPKNRLGLARWTTDPNHPLTARVEVNRLWAMCFGRGLVASQENFGLQGDVPSHAEVLDLLAVDFVASGWDVKRLLKRIALSATFRQSSNATPEKLAQDPDDRWLSRGPSVRLSAEMLRDQALCASGLLAEKIGGPSVKPWQPPGIWEDAGVSMQGAYTVDLGENAHRRSLYTYRKRTAPPPDMLVFDAGSREKCLARRQPTNTPLQQLVLLDDPVFFECARALAVRVAKERTSVDERLTLAFRRLAVRAPRAVELDALRGLFARELDAFGSDAQAAHAVTASDVGEAELAALTLVCSTLIASDAVVVSR